MNKLKHEYSNVKISLRIVLVNPKGIQFDYTVYILKINHS